MRKRITQFVVGLFLGLTSLHAQVECTDLNGFVDHKNTGGTGYYTLSAGNLEKASQTYYYSGPGKLSTVRIYGMYPSLVGGVPLTVGVYNVDAAGRPTSAIKTTNITWWWFNNISGYMDVPLGSAVTLNKNFAVEVEIHSTFPWGNTFMVQYTGDGEGGKQDLASLAGTATGNNWVSAMANYSKDGDFYIVPKMTNFVTAGFTTTSQCAGVADPITFNNATQMSVDSMFNTIGLAGYSGGAHYYTWNFGDGSPVSNAVSPTHSYTTAGAYTVTLTSTLAGWTGNCIDTKTMTISVGLAAGTTSIVNENCYGDNNGSVTGTGTGGATPYVFSINGGAAYQSNPNFTGLGAGSYTMYVKDNVGCTSTSSFVITQPAQIVFSSVSTTNASCGKSDGGILVSATGGTGTLQYKLGTGSYQASGSFTGLAAGAYLITVKDANGCTASQTIGVSDLGGPSLTLSSMTNVSCNGGSDGSIVLSATGGSGTLQYSINGGVTYQFSSSFPNVAAGNYVAMVKDAAGCSQSMNITIGQPAALSITASALAAHCNGSNDGQANVTSATGGTGTFVYSIDGVHYQSGTNFPGLTAGTYTVTVKDVAGCTATTSVSVTQPAALSAVVTVTSSSCNGSDDGVITVVGSGGTAPYQYSIGTGMEDPQGAETFDGLSAGTYVVGVVDENGCSYTTTATVTQPSLIAATINTTNSTCGNANGGILASASGGSGSGYQYSIDGNTFSSSGSFTGLNAGTYYVVVHDGSGCSNVFPATVMDANGPSIVSSSFTNVACNGGNDGTITINTVTGGTGTLQYSINGTNWQTSTMFTGLTAGLYTVTVKDANGCTGTTTITLTEPNPFVINTTTTNVTCYNGNSGSVTVAASGGAGTLAYSIDGGVTFQSSTVFNNLSAGSYTVMVRDFAGCSGSATFNIDQPLPIVAHATWLNVLCHGANSGAITLFGNGGSGIYTYSIDGIHYQSSNVFTGLSGGVYTGYVKDASGCISTITVTVNEPAAMSVTATTSNISCYQGSNGLIVLNVNGGVSPYAFQWSNEAQGQSINNLTAGVYTVTVTDDNGCSTTAGYNLTQPANPIVLNGVVNNASTSTSTDGGVLLTPTGGTSPYSFSWSNGSTSQNLYSVGVGTYTVTVTDANGCISTMVFTVAVVTGVDELSANGENVTLYPNPTNNIATLDANGGIISRVRVMDILGQVITETEPKQTKVLIQSATLRQGIYFVEVTINGKVITKRMSVIK